MRLCPAQHSGSSAVGNFRIRYSRYLPACAAGKHHHDEARIVLPISGEFHSDYGRRSIPVLVGGALYRPRNEDHRDHYGVPTDCISLLLSNSGGFARLNEPIAADQAELGRAALSLRAEAGARDVASDLIVEGLATLITSIVLDRSPVVERDAPPWVARVREYLDNCNGAAPSLTDLANNVGRNPAHVAATFRRIYGVSAGVYLRRLKLWQAREQIDADPSIRLAAVRSPHSPALLPMPVKAEHGAAPGAYGADAARFAKLSTSPP